MGLLWTHLSFVGGFMNFFGTLVVLVTALSVSVGCGKLQGVLDSAGAIPERMKETNKNLEKTSEAVRKQGMAASVESMFSARARAELYPVPVGVLPGASNFGAFASSQELVEVTNLWLARIDKTEKLTKFDEQGNEIPLSLDERNADLVERYHYFQALSAVAALAPQEKVQEIATVHIQSLGSRYRKAAQNFLMLRAYFLRTVLIGESLLSKDFTAVGEAEEAVRLQKNVDWILTQPFANTLFVKTLGLKAPGNYSKIQNLDLKMDLDTKTWLVEPWQQVQIQLEQIFRVTARGDTGDPNRDLEIYQQELKTVEALLNDAKAQNLKWKEILK